LGGSASRVAADAKHGRDLLAGLTKLGFDEIAIRKGHRYLTVVVDHHSGRLVWAHAGRDRRTVEKFLDLLGQDRLKQTQLVSCDNAAWITGPISERCPNAVICLDPWVRHEALPVRVGCETPPPGCRGSPRKLRAARPWSMPVRISCSEALKQAQPTACSRRRTIGI